MGIERVVQHEPITDGEEEGRQRVGTGLSRSVSGSSATPAIEAASSAPHARDSLNRSEGVRSEVNKQTNRSVCWWRIDVDGSTDQGAGT